MKNITNINEIYGDKLFLIETPSGGDYTTCPTCGMDTTGDTFLDIIYYDKTILFISS